MEISETEITSVEDAQSKALAKAVVTLNDLQLALIAGGAGDVAFG